MDRHGMKHGFSGVDRTGNAAAAPYCPSARITMFERSIAITTQDLVSGPVRRPAISVLLSLDDTPFSISINDVPVPKARAFVVRELAPRAIQALNCQLLSLSLDPGHPLFLSTRKALGDKEFLALPDGPLRACRDPLRGELLGAVPRQPDDRLIEALLSSAPDFSLHLRAKSASRREHLLAQFESQWTEPHLASKLAAAMDLSVSRLSHLFVEEVGVPLRTYTLWRKYRHACARLQSPGNLSTLAQDCGFSDAAHMTRTFVSYLGFSPTMVKSLSHIHRPVEAHRA
ncbi:putative Transcriptional regulator, helix-turn-helix, AraC family [Cupriavidus metallidurans CH34]|uniref:Transcriptional regulator, helix-turn-helix, AraC family n=2 Tax=Cupriavidus metallidurans TaxID=119219 RepID=Q1LMK4_CUPMC|nr:putative Transcriptional regulator, helix-turn-helix, AraC family [Cupriavidus metallidurans CH34]QGS30444.1 helix-turn-helix domain-containing protein [Cupriavidus metallidurans]